MPISTFIPSKLSKKWIFLGLMMTTSLSHAASLSQAEVEILDQLRNAQQQLSSTELRIGKERSALSSSLNKAEARIRRLQDETAASRRLADEATLSIQQLEERLESWEEQSFFQQNLMGRFKQQVDGESWVADTPLTDKINWLSGFINQQQSELYPQWQPQEIVMPNGELQAAETLSIGPVSWYWQDQAQSGGFISEENGRSEVTLALSGAENTTLADLHDNQSGNIIFDPTLSRALRLAQEKETVLDHISKGGLWAFPILAFAAFALTIALLKALQLWRLPAVIPALTESLQSANQQKTLANVKGMQAELLSIVRGTPVGQIRDDRLFAKLMECKHRLEYWLGAIAITAAVSPLLGLLGTVSGMIEAFRLMTLFGAGDPAAVSSGISEALVTTELGLIVAIPSLVLHALLSRRVKSYYGQLENCTVKLSQIKIKSKNNSSNPSTSTPPPSQGLPA